MASSASSFSSRMCCMVGICLDDESEDREALPVPDGGESDYLHAVQGRTGGKQTTTMVLNHGLKPVGLHARSLPLTTAYSAIRKELSTEIGHSEVLLSIITLNSISLFIARIQDEKHPVF